MFYFQYEKRACVKLLTFWTISFAIASLRHIQAYRLIMFALEHLGFTVSTDDFHSWFLPEFFAVRFIWEVATIVVTIAPQWLRNALAMLTSHHLARTYFGSCRNKVEDDQSLQIAWDSTYYWFKIPLTTIFFIIRTIQSAITDPRLRNALIIRAFEFVLIACSAIWLATIGQLFIFSVRTILNTGETNSIKCYLKLF